MFGFKIISKKKYDAIVEEGSKSIEREEKIVALKWKIEEQSYIIEDMVSLNKTKALKSGCKIGPWCKDCSHCKIFTQNDYKFMAEGDFEAYSFVGSAEKENEYIYCKKHIHEICPEWQGKAK